MPTLFPTRFLKFPDALRDGGDLSGIVFLSGADRLAVCSDEGNVVEILERKSDVWKLSVVVPVPIDGGDGAEADFESVEVSGDWLYVIGSHSARRKTIDSTKSRKKNFERLADVKQEASRRILAKMRISTLESPQPEVVTDGGALWKAIASDEILKRFTEIPSKENGVDIEGLTLDGDTLIVGFRGPVLRGGLAVVMRTKFGSPKGELQFLNLDGRGIRDLVRLDAKRFLVLAGPVGDEETSYQLYWWDGSDGLPGSDAPATSGLRLIGDVPPPNGAPDANAEGIAVAAVSASETRIIVVYDGVPGGAPSEFRIAHSAP